MNVFFVALGATRIRAVKGESAQVVAEGGRAVVLIDKPGSWGRDGFATGVDVVQVTALERRHWPIVVETLLLFRAPRFLVRTTGRGRLAGWAERAARTYERRIATPVHWRVFQPVYRRVCRRVRQRMIERHILRGASFDLIVVGDPASMPDAARLYAAYGRRRERAPRICFGLDYAGA